jgi:hypothetical protein
MKENGEIAEEVLQQYASIVGDWIPKDATIAIAVGDRYIYYVEGIHDIRLLEGQPVIPGSIADKVINNRLKVDKVMDNTLFGAPYYGIGYPIDLQGEPGALLVILPSNYNVLKHEPFRFLTGKQEEDWCPVPIEEIAYIESLQKKTWFYVDGEQFRTSHTLKDLQSRLPKTFLRIHRSYIVNILSIERISRDITSNLLLTLKDGTELPISQTYMTEVKKALGF